MSITDLSYLFSNSYDDLKVGKEPQKCRNSIKSWDESIDR